MYNITTAIGISGVQEKIKEEGNGGIHVQGRLQSRSCSPVTVC